MTDDLRTRLAEALTREHYRRARERIAASPEEHCAAFANVAMAVVQPELDLLKASLAAQIGFYKSAEEDVTKAEAAIERVRALHVRNANTGDCELCSEHDYPDYSVPSPCPTIAALDQLKERT